MERFWQKIKQYLHYKAISGDEHSIHSPFVYGIYTQVIQPYKHYYIFEEIEKIRKQYLDDDTIIEVTDFGAGGEKRQNYPRKINEIAKTSLSSPQTGQLLFKLIDYFAPDTIVELGTSLGVTTLYMLAAKKQYARLYTIEGCPQIASFAEKSFDALRYKPHLLVGKIDDKMPSLLNSLQKVDFVFIDANHRKEATIHYFETLLRYIHEDSVLIFDDIHWSKEMQEAWEYVYKHQVVTISIDLYQIGLVFFRQKQPKQHFILKF